MYCLTINVDTGPGMLLSDCSVAKTSIFRGISNIPGEPSAQVEMGNILYESAHITHKPAGEVELLLKGQLEKKKTNLKNSKKDCPRLDRCTERCTYSYQSSTRCTIVSTLV